MNKLNTQKRVQILALMAEGCLIRSITRLTGCSKNTVIKFMVDAGCAVSEFQDRTLRNLPCKKVQVDEIWGFCYAKQKNVKKAKAAPEGAGDVWTWVAIDADTKLVPSWLVGGRDAGYAHEFMQDLASRLSNRIQLTSDGLKAYLEAVEGAFGADIDFAQLVKMYGDAPEGQKRYSPAECIGCQKRAVTGKPDQDDVSTSYSERQNLSMRMGSHRLTRLTNAFSKKFENHAHAMALYFMHYNFVRIHQTLRVTPAMAAGVTDKLWDFIDVVRVIERWEAKQLVQKRGPYKKKIQTDPLPKRQLSHIAARMPKSFTPELKRLLLEAGCYKVRSGKGDHEVWYSPVTKRPFVVDGSIPSRHTANGALKQAGLPKAF